MLAVLIAALAASAGGCGDDNDPNKNTGGTGGAGADGGTGGVGGEGGVGGTGGIPDVPCEEDDDCAAFERCDQEEKICVPRCTRDSECGRNTGLRCDMENGGICIPGQPCDGNQNCGRNPEFGYCASTPCACIPDQTMQGMDPPRNGVCWRTSSVCDECADDIECGNGAVCVPYTHSGETRNVCLRGPGGSGVCGAGTLPADVPENDPLHGLCVPQFGDCGNFRPCRDDSDCDQMNPVCDRKRQICIPGCNFDYELKRSQGCPPERVCHATKEGTDYKLLDDCATAHLYGVGRCAPPCESDDECKENGENWTCKTYGQESRCVPIDRTDDNACLSDYECANTGRGEIKGFCDARTRTCNDTGCRIGRDPFQGCTKDYEDCTSQYKCVMDPETEDRFVGMCVEKDCIDKGGAQTGCGFAEFCANEQYRDMFTGERLSDKRTEVPPGVKSGECFPMDAGAWCLDGCAGHQECAGMTVTSYPDLPHLCVQVSQDATACAPACKYSQDCPSSWRCEGVGKLLCNEDNPIDSFKFCEEDVDCGGGGKCVVPKVEGANFRFPSSMEPWKVCTCDPTQANSCGGGEFACNAGIATAKVEDGKVIEHYCSKPGSCGAKGSCEFMGTFALEAPMNPASPTHPLFYCGNDAGVVDVQASCPPSHVKGQNRGDQFYCVVSQVCLPWLNEDGVCGVPTGQ
jgi:hypothetical protein